MAAFFKGHLANLTMWKQVMVMITEKVSVKLSVSLLHLLFDCEYTQIL